MSFFGDSRGKERGLVSEMKGISFDRDAVVQYYDHSHIVILKTFKSIPYCKDYKKTSSGRSDEGNINSEFHVRCYMPREVMLQRNSKVKQCIVMLNGLDELTHVTLYDQLGLHFARRGIASILLPTPHHLNRHSDNDLKKPSEYVADTEDPHNPLLLYHNTVQCINDVKSITNKIMQKEKDKTDEMDNSFYEHYFAGEATKVSLLGYSLGGLRALSCLLLEPKVYNCCFLLNSGFKLEDLMLERIDIKKKDWDDIVIQLKRLVQNPSNHSEVKKVQKQPFFNDYFNPLFLGDERGNLKDQIVELAKRVLLIVGGNDEIVKPDFMKLLPAGNVVKTESTVFQIPGVTHLLSLDEEWVNWIGLTCELMYNFQKNVNNDLIPFEEIVDGLRTISELYDIFNEDHIEKFDEALLPELLDKIKSNSKEKEAKEKEAFDREEFLRLYFISKAFPKKFEDIIKAIFNPVKKAKAAEKVASDAKKIALKAVYKSSDMKAAVEKARYAAELTEKAEFLTKVAKEFVESIATKKKDVATLKEEEVKKKTGRAKEKTITKKIVDDAVRKFEVLEEKKKEAEEAVEKAKSCVEQKKIERSKVLMKVAASRAKKEAERATLVLEEAEKAVENTEKKAKELSKKAKALWGIVNNLKSSKGGGKSSKKKDSKKKA